MAELPAGVQARITLRPNESIQSAWVTLDKMLYRERMPDNYLVLTNFRVLSVESEISKKGLVWWRDQYCHRLVWERDLGSIPSPRLKKGSGTDSVMIGGKELWPRLAPPEGIVDEIGYARARLSPPDILPASWGELLGRSVRSSSRKSSRFGAVTAVL